MTGFIKRTFADAEIESKQRGGGRKPLEAPLWRQAAPISYGVRREYKIKAIAREKFSRAYEENHIPSQLVNSSSVFLEEDAANKVNEYLSDISEDRILQSPDQNVLAGEITGNQLEQTCHTILLLLDKQSLNLENIACSLNVKEDEVYRAVNLLLERGDIEDIKTRIFQRLFSLLGNKKNRKQTFSKEDTYFTLTSKGFFKLHPLVSFK